MDIAIKLFMLMLLSDQTDADYKCYSCSSENGDVCSRVNENTTVIVCKNGCAKIRTQPLVGDPLYTRGCSASKHFKGCESINIIGNMKKECDCRQDLCNHSNQLVSRLLLYLIIFMTVYSLSMRRYI